jgi:hypothetical protein
MLESHDDLKHEKAKYKALLGFEPRSSESEPEVITNYTKEPAIGLGFGMSSLNTISFRLLNIYSLYFISLGPLIRDTPIKPIKIADYKQTGARA